MSPERLWTTDAQGWATVAWRDNVNETSTSDDIIRASKLKASLRPGPAVRVSSQAFVVDPLIAVDEHGRASVAWTEDGIVPNKRVWISREQSG